MKSIGQLWRGDLPLDAAFWLWAVTGGLFVNLVSSLGFLFLMMADQVLVAVLIGYGLSIPYNILVTVGVWRSADRYDGERRWAELARTVTVVGMVLLGVT